MFPRLEGDGPMGSSMFVFVWYKEPFGKERLDVWRKGRLWFGRHASAHIILNLSPTSLFSSLHRLVYLFDTHQSLSPLATN